MMEASLLILSLLHETCLSDWFLTWLVAVDYFFFFFFLVIVLAVDLLTSYFPDCWDECKFLLVPYSCPLKAVYG